ncbi:hypothetical protein [Pseudomonas asiatica]|uniref:hypothetical protein n=1 Tax=Pseudomonas asiatica TaxID=2219225 RepID=UPI0037CC6A9A
MKKSFQEQLTEFSCASIWDLLPEDFKSIPEDVKRKTGIEIKVLPISACPRPLFELDEAPAVVDIDGSSQSITIWCAPSKITASIVGHELLHIRRDILEQQPKMMPIRCNAQKSSLIHMIENELEHLIIIREEIVNFADAEDRWASAYERIVDNAINRPKPDLLELILTWLQLRSSLPNQTKIATKLANHLKSLEPQWAKTIDYVRHIMMESLPDKAKLIHTILTELKQITPETTNSIGIGRWEMHEGSLIFSLKMLNGKRVN